MRSFPGSPRLLKGDVVLEDPDSEAAIKAAAPGTHTAMAHDDPTTKNYTLARRLAALVIHDLGTDVLAVKRPRTRRLHYRSGVAISTTILRNQAWFQIGAGVVRPFPFEPLPGGSIGDEHGAALVAGAQITGRF